MGSIHVNVIFTSERYNFFTLRFPGISLKFCLFCIDSNNRQYQAKKHLFPHFKHALVSIISGYGWFLYQPSNIRKLKLYYNIRKLLTAFQEF